MYHEGAGVGSYQSFIEDLISCLDLRSGELSQRHLLQVNLELDQVLLHSLHVEDEANQFLNFRRQFRSFTCGGKQDRTPYSISQLLLGRGSNESCGLHLN